MTVKTLPWDSAAALRSDEDIAAYMEAALEEAAEAGDDRIVAHALDVISRARTLSGEHGSLQADTDSGSAFEANPSLSMLLRRMKKLNIRLHVEPETA